LGCLHFLPLFLLGPQSNPSIVVLVVVDTYR
jgi:hypothetical protein